MRGCLYLLLCRLLLLILHKLGLVAIVHVGEHGIPEDQTKADIANALLQRDKSKVDKLSSRPKDPVELERRPNGALDHGGSLLHALAGEQNLRAEKCRQNERSKEHLIQNSLKKCSLRVLFLVLCCVFLQTVRTLMTLARMALPGTTRSSAPYQTC